MIATRVKLISAKMQTGFVPSVTKLDRRYKKGYKILSDGYNTFQMRLKTNNPKGILRVGQNVLTPWGLFRVINNNFLSLDGQSEMIQTKAIEKGNEFEFNPEFDILPLGFTVGEGSASTDELNRRQPPTPDECFKKSN